jgi:hypothetical protein
MDENLSLPMSMQPTVFMSHSESDHRHHQKVVKAIVPSIGIDGFFEF